MVLKVPNTKALQESLGFWSFVVHEVISMFMLSIM